MPTKPAAEVAATSKGRADAPAASQSVKALRDNATIVSTFRIRVDECDRLWVMDTGLADILGAPEQVAAPALVIFDLKTDQLIRRFEFAPEDAKEDTFFANVVSVNKIAMRFRMKLESKRVAVFYAIAQIVDVNKDSCDDAYAYVPDLGAYGVVVYSFRDNQSWRVKHNFFHFDPLNGEYTVSGVNFQWTDGVFGMAMGKPTTDG